MTSYGTIPTSSNPGATTSTNIDYISRAKDKIKQSFGTRKPWNFMFNLHSFSLPHNHHEALSRFKVNATYFSTNYAIMVLVILFLSLLWHPVSLIIFIIMIAAWLFLYFMRDQPLVVAGREVSDGVVLGVLGVLTVVVLLFTGVGLNVLVSVLIGACGVVVHGVLRKTDDLFLEDEDGSAGLIAHSGSVPASSSG